jgi:hypothetical protein
VFESSPNLPSLLRRNYCSATEPSCLFQLEQKKEGVIKGNRVCEKLKNPDATLYTRAVSKVHSNS